MAIHAAGEVVAHQTESLLAGKLIFTQQTEELVNVGHRAPVVLQGGAVGGIGIFHRLQRAQGQRCRRRHPIFRDQGLPGRHVGLRGRIDFQQGVAVVVEKLDALTAIIVQMEGAGPLAEEQTQVERARVQHQPGVAAEVLVRELAHLLMHGILVAADAFGFADALQGGNQRPGVIAQAHGIMAEAGGGQLGFADPHFRGDIAGIFRGTGRFGGLVALPQVRVCIWHNHILLDDEYPRPAGRGQVRYYSGNQKSTLTPSCQVRPGITASALSLASWLVPVSILRLLR